MKFTSISQRGRLGKRCKRHKKPTVLGLMRKHTGTASLKVSGMTLKLEGRDGALAKLEGARNVEQVTKGSKSLPRESLMKSLLPSAEAS